MYITYNMPYKKKKKRSKYYGRSAGYSNMYFRSSRPARGWGYANIRRLATKWDNRVYEYKQKIILSQITMSSAHVTNVAYQFLLNDLPQVSTFTNLYDQYKISWVKLQFIPVNTQVNINAAASPVSISYCPMAYCVIDYDDNTALSVRNDYFQYQNCQFKRMTNPFTVSFRPHMAVAAYSGTFISYTNKMPEWIDCNSPSVAHYGVKFGIDAGASAMDTYAAYDCIATYWVKFRNVR